MRLELSARLFGTPVEDHLRRQILGFAVDGRHNVIVQVGALDLFTGWRSRQSIEAQEEIDFAVDRSLQEEALQPHRLGIVVGGVADDENWGASPPILSARAARDLGSQALRILVEDIDSDGQFLVALAPPEYSSEYRLLLDEGWAEVVHGGGTRLMSMIESAGEDAGRRSRSFVIHDSDAPAPGAVSEWARRLDRLCDELGFSRHCLERRESENYLPPQAIRRWAQQRWRDRGARARAWFGLQPVQRHHFDMKSGFGDRDPPSLYDSMTLADRTVLRQGFGPDVWREFHDINPDWIDRDGQRPELVAVFASILGLR